MKDSNKRNSFSLKTFFFLSLVLVSCGQTDNIFQRSGLERPDKEPSSDLDPGYEMTAYSNTFITNTNICNRDTLKNAASCHDLLIGSPNWLKDGVSETHKKEMNMQTATFYWLALRNQGPSFWWEESDAWVKYGRDNNMVLHGHPLIWPKDQMTPEWVKAYNGDFKELLREHIRTVMGRYKGQIKIWDVVNESIADSGTEHRRSLWHDKVNGIELIKLAFSEARKVDPNAILLYNDYDIERHVNTRKYQFLKDKILPLKKQGVPIDGIGWQLHCHIDEVLADDYPLEQRLQEVASLGFVNYITELDIPIPDNSKENLERQKRAYKKIVEIFLRVPKAQRGGLQTWGTTDRFSWLGSHRHPLLFDSDMNRKPAYYGVLDALMASQTPVETAPADSDLGSSVSDGTYRIMNVKYGSFLNKSGEQNYKQTGSHSYVDEWWSMQWTLKKVNSHFRIQNRWAEFTSLHASSGTYGFAVSTAKDVPNWWSQDWQIIALDDEKFMIVNRWLNRSLALDDKGKAVVVETNKSNIGQHWKFTKVHGT